MIVGPPCRTMKGHRCYSIFSSFSDTELRDKIGKWMENKRKKNENKEA